MHVRAGRVKFKVMPPRISMEGQCFGRLQVIACAGHSLSASPEYTWRCLCSCGREAVVRGWSLRSGRTKSCGCLQSQVTTDRNRFITPKCKLADGVASLNSKIRWYRWNSLKRGLQWTLTNEDCYRLFKTSCGYCGVEPMQLVKNTRSTPSLYNGIDRVDNSQGYTLENVMACCKMCNHAKRNHSVADFLGWVERVSNYQSGKSLTK